MMWLLETCSLAEPNSPRAGKPRQIQLQDGDKRQFIASAKKTGSEQRRVRIDHRAGSAKVAPKDHVRR